MENTKIEWAEHTANLWSGCTKVSPACQFCYAEEMSRRFPALGKWGPGAPRVRHHSAYKMLRKINRQAVGMERRPRVFINSLSDWLDDEVPLQWLADLAVLITECSNIDFLLLTKRPENFAARLDQVDGVMNGVGASGEMVLRWITGTPPSNVWIGTTVEDQQRADERIPALLEIPAKVRFLSCEPLLGPVDLEPETHHSDCNFRVGRCDCDRGCENGTPGAEWLRNIHWVICGGESGRNARPMHPDWARSLRDQCQAAGVPFFFKQWGEWLPGGNVTTNGKIIPDCLGSAADDERNYHYFKAPDHGKTWRVGKKAAGRLLDGREWNEFPV